MLQQHPLLIPMEGRIYIILNNLVPAEQQAIDRFCIKQRHVEGLEGIILDSNCVRPAAMKILPLMLQVRDFRIDGDYGVCELVHACKHIDEPVPANSNIVASASLEPAIAVAA